MFSFTRLETFQDIGKVETTLQDKLMTQWDGSHAKGLELTIRSRTAVQDAYVGCSIAVNGVCLTVTSITPPQVFYHC